MIALVVHDSKGTRQGIAADPVGIVHEAHRNFVLFAVAIQIFALKRFQRFVQLVRRRRYGKSYRIQPFLVDPHRIRRLIERSIHHFRKRVNFAVRMRNGRLVLWMFLEYRFQVWRILIDQIVKREQYALVRPISQIDSAWHRSVYGVGVIPACEHEIQLFHLGRFVDKRPVDMDVCFLFQPLEQFILVIIHNFACTCFKGQDVQIRLLGERKREFPFRWRCVRRFCRLRCRRARNTASRIRIVLARGARSQQDQ